MTIPLPTPALTVARSATCALALFAATLLALPPALAGDGGAEDRFHGAYALEVVDGDVAQAARTYLELVNDTTAPARIRAESRFRFAVCSVLLGRPDEARTLLGELAADESVPASLRERARSYAASIDGVGVGSEVDRKLQELLFELGRADVTKGDVAVYRDFEILGAAARPFLRKLLAHADVTVRQHAFRLLCRMDEPDLIEHWRFEATRDGSASKSDLAAYLRRHPAQLPELQRRLLALPDAELDLFLGRTYAVPRFDAAFLDAIEARDVSARSKVRASSGHANAERWPRLVRLADASEGALAREAVLNLTVLAPRFAAQGSVRPGQLVAWVDHLLAADRGDAVHRYRNHAAKDPVTEGLRSLGRRAPADDVITAFEHLVAAGRQPPAQGDVSPIRYGYQWALYDALATHMHEDRVDPARCARLLIDLDAVLRARSQDGTALPRERTGRVNSELAVRLRRTLERLPPGELAQVGAELLAAADPRGVVELAHLLPYREPENAAAILDALAVLAPPQRRDALEKLANAAFDHASARFGRGAAELLTRDLARPQQRGDLRSDQFLQYGVLALASLPQDLARERFAAHLEAVGQAPEERRAKVGLAVVRTALHASTLDVHTRVIAPQLPRLFELMPTPSDRSYLVQYAKSAIETADEEGLELGDARDLYAAFVRRNYALLHGGWNDLARFPGLYPITGWLPYVHAGSWSNRPAWVATALRKHATPEHLDAAAEQLTRAPNTVTRNVIAYVRHMASEEARTRILERLLRDASVAELRVVFEEYDRAPARGSRPASLPVGEEALHEALRRLSEAGSTDLWALQWIAEFVQRTHPSERLYPAARRLLRAEERASVLAGIALTGQLGRTDLIPDLVAKLDSMDEVVRSGARRAIDSIQQLERLRKQARETYGEDE